MKIKYTDFVNNDINFVNDFLKSEYVVKFVRKLKLINNILVYDYEIERLVKELCTDIFDIKKSNTINNLNTKGYYFKSNKAFLVLIEKIDDELEIKLFANLIE